MLAWIYTGTKERRCYNTIPTHIEQQTESPEIEIQRTRYNSMGQFNQRTIGKAMDRKCEAIYTEREH
jgi:hypothetical protein